MYSSVHQFNHSFIHIFTHYLSYESVSKSITQSANQSSSKQDSRLSTMLTLHIGYHSHERSCHPLLFQLSSLCDISVLMTFLVGIGPSSASIASYTLGSDCILYLCATYCRFVILLLTVICFRSVQLIVLSFIFCTYRLFANLLFVNPRLPINLI